MRRNPIALSIVMGLFSAPVMAHHGHHHEEPPAPPVPVAAPAPPPPPPPPPAPVVQASPPPPINVQLPQVFTHPVVPTDFTGPGGSLGHAKGIENAIGVPQKSFKKPAPIARDHRFAFSGEWLALEGSKGEQNEESTANNRSTGDRKVGKIEHWVMQARDRESAFMHTTGADFAVSGNEILLDKGAVLVRGGQESVTVSMILDGQKVTIRIAAGALALVSDFDGKPTVLNLTDRCCGSVVAFLPSDKGGEERVSIGISEVLEVHRTHEKPHSTYISTKVLSNHHIKEGIGVQISRCHYLTCMRKFNLDKALPSQELNKVLKTAAAMAYVQPGKK